MPNSSVDLSILCNHNITGLESLVYDSVTRVLSALSLENRFLTISLIDDIDMMILNRDFRGINKTTDVLAFESNHFDPENQKHSIGDVAISLPEAQRNCVLEHMGKP